MASLTLDRISKHFGPVVALSDVSLHVEDGEFCVLLGPSGCGKSTLLQIVAGLIRQDQGSERIRELIKARSQVQKGPVRGGVNGKM